MQNQIRHMVAVTAVVFAAIGARTPNRQTCQEMRSRFAVTHRPYRRRGFLRNPTIPLTRSTSREISTSIISWGSRCGFIHPLGESEAQVPGFIRPRQLGSAAHTDA
jgi:hypothetical protein